MRFIHLSDLHIGKRISEYSMLEDQEYILGEIRNIIDQEKPDGIIIAGDLYDKTMPSSEAVSIVDNFLSWLCRRKLKVFIVSGNHDSPERIAYCSGILKSSNIYISPVYDGKITSVRLKDEYGELCVSLMPFLKPSYVRRWYPDENIESYTDAVKVALSHTERDDSVRNIIVAHQFVTGASVCDSEEISVGGSENVDGYVFDGYDYVALGHLHGPQNVGKNTIRYCGTPLKYSFSEKDHKKSVTVVDIKEKGNVAYHTILLKPKYDLREIRGCFEELTSKEYYENTNTDDYLRIVLTDEQDIPDVSTKLRVIYPHYMKIAYDNARTRAEAAVGIHRSDRYRTETEIFSEFFEKVNGRPMSDEQAAFAADLFRKIKEGKR